MQLKSAYAPSITCRLILIDPESMLVLTVPSASGPLLPRQSISRDARFAEALTEAIEKKYGLSTIQLALLPESEELGYCAIHEILATKRAMSDCRSFVGLLEINALQLTLVEQELVTKIINGDAPELGKFARLGWLNELFGTMENYLSLNRSVSVRQLNQGIDFSLLQLYTRISIDNGADSQVSKLPAWVGNLPSRMECLGVRSYRGSAS
jgi:hypothetical protein